MLSLVILLSCLASAHGYWCGICNVLDKEYCCFDQNDSNYCCSLEEYLKGGFMDTKTMAIIAAVSVVIAVIVFISVCCFCCPCCPCYRRRRQGAVYNSVPGASAQTLRSPISQTAAVAMDSRLSQAQYPVQHASNPYIDPNASAPPYVSNHN